MKKLSPVELSILKGLQFSADKLVALAEGTAPPKIYAQAVKALRRYVLGSMSRQEAMSSFVLNEIFDNFLNMELMPRMNRLLAAVDVLKDKGVFIEEDIEDKLKSLVAESDKEAGQ